MLEIESRELQDAMLEDEFTDEQEANVAVGDAALQEAKVEMGETCPPARQGFHMGSWP